MASAELLKMTHGVDGKVMGVDGRVKGVEEKVQDVRDDVQNVGDKVQDVDDRVQDIGKGISIRVQGVDDKLDQANRSLSLQYLFYHSDGSNNITGNQLRDNLLRWLSPSDPSTNQNIACKARHKGTAEWFFRGRTFSQWKSTDSLLWIHGKRVSHLAFTVRQRVTLIFSCSYSGVREKCPVVRPSSDTFNPYEIDIIIFSSSIIQDITSLSDAGRALLVYFYFDFRDADKQKLHDLLPSLLIQLSARSDPCCGILSQLYTAHDRGVRKPSDRAMVECLKEMLSLEAQPPIYIVLDALDECPVTSTVPPSPREEVLEFVDELVTLHLPNLHICVTSRPEHDIRVVLERLTEHPVSLHDESGQQEDITNYVTSFVCSNQRMQRWRDEDKNLVIKTLSKKADGM
jgi:hypothetical protein